MPLSNATSACLEPRNLAHATAKRWSWTEEFQLAERVSRFDPASPLANPHTWQRVELPVDGFPELDTLALRRALDVVSSPRRPYHRRKGEVKSTVHWGQRKLLLAELEFLTEYSKDADVVIYAGAAPGGHLKLLCELFPALSFEAYDPRPFDKGLSGVGAPGNLCIKQEPFTDKHAECAAQSGQVSLFISDIRTADWQQQQENDHDASLIEDLSAQRRWVEQIKPKWALLKFRLPYTDGVTDYLAGEIRFPVWGPQTTTECRLVVAGDLESLPTTRYDHRRLIEQLFYFNTVTRISIYPRPKTLCVDAEVMNSAFLNTGLCSCFDCTREVDIVAGFFKSFHSDVTYKDVLDLSGKLSIACGRGVRGLLDVFPPPWTAPCRLALSPDACRKRRLEEQSVAARTNTRRRTT